MNRAEPVRPKDWVRFQCQRCGRCCRNLENQLMLEPLDAYNLARLLRERGDADLIEDVCERYAHLNLLEGCLPIYLVNTVGPDHTCIFLKDSRCTIYDSRPYVCRIYPFSVQPGERGKTFAFYQCVDDHADHFSEKRIQVKDWLNQNFSRESRTFWTAEGNVLPVLGKLLSSLRTDELQVKLFQVLYYRYCNYDLDQPFMPQYMRNMEALKGFLTRNGTAEAKLSNPFQNRVDMAKSMFGVLPPDVTLEEAREERLGGYEE